MQPLYSTLPTTTDKPFLRSISTHSMPPSFSYYYSMSSCPSRSAACTILLSSTSASSSPLLSSSSSSSTIANDTHTTPSPALYCPSSLSSPPSSVCLSVSIVPRLLHPFFSSSDLLSHSAALFTLSDLLTLATLNRSIAALARSERIWGPRLQTAIAIRYPTAAHLADDSDEQDEQKQSQHSQRAQRQHHQQLQQQNQEATVQFTCPYLSAMQQSRSDKGGNLSSLPHLVTTNPFVSDLVQQLEASTTKESTPRVSVAAAMDAAQQSTQLASTSTASSTVTVLSSLSAPLFYSPFSSSSSSSASSLSSKTRYIALSQCSLHCITGCSRLVAPLPPLPAPTTQAYWAHTRVLHYPAPPSLYSCDPWPTLPLCAECRASLAVCMKDYYDYRGEWAGQFTMTPLSIVIVHPPDVLASSASNKRPCATLDVRYSHLGGYDGVDHRRFEVEYVKAGHSGCTCGCAGLSAGVSAVGEWSVRVLHRYRSGIYAMDSPLNVTSNDRLEYSHLRERERLAQRKRKNNVTAVQSTALSMQSTAGA